MENNKKFFGLNGLHLTIISLLILLAIMYYTGPNKPSKNTIDVNDLKATTTNTINNDDKATITSATSTKNDLPKISTTTINKATIQKQ
jgi:hypothetical protein